MKAVRRICAFVAGFFFFIAGVLKLMDPVGAGLVVGEYFNFLHLSFLAPLSRVAGIAMALLETVLGTAMLTGVWRRLTGTVTGIVMAAFTLLTLVLWIANPPMDCGCFGEAVHLTHRQSFLKNVVLCILWLLAFVIPGGEIPVPRKAKYAAFGIVTISLGLFTLYSVLSIPMMDFTPFKPGAVLMQAEMEPDGSSPLLSFTDASGMYMDELAAEGNVAAASVYDPERMTSKAWDAVSEALAAASDAGMIPLLLVASTPDDFTAPGADPQLAGNIYFADRRTLMTLNRSNGGATYLSDGQVVAKWAVRSLPDISELSDLAGMDATEAMVQKNTPQRLKLQGFLLYAFSLMLLL